ncbi:toxin-antitoxin system YwqK family antitoxin [Flagellimonas sp. S174]|uniref:toxin-antitoxin system YwqK family antitoxin n=1 Tax=Flagellimonas sp. S174 TaxID=3410790 RepID=UPI003BF48898
MSFFQETIKEHRIVSIKWIPAFLLLFVFLLVGNTKNTVPDARIIKNVEVEKELLQLNRFEGRWYHEGAPFNGYSVKTHKNGQIAEKTGFIYGKRQGPSLKWYEDGMLYSQKNYNNNGLEGTSKTWWPNGQQSTESNYRNRQRHGKQIKWYPNGQLAGITQFNKGKEEGLQQAWLQTGKLYANYEAKNGRFFGLRRSNLCYQLKNEVVQK